MNVADKAAVDAAKNGKGKARSGSTSKESAKAGANRIVQFIDEVSDRASDQVADAISAATIQKAMQKMGVGNGPLTQAAINQFDAVFTEVLVDQLPSLTGADGGAKYFLTSASDTDEGGLN